MYYPVIDREILWKNIHIYLFLIILSLIIGIFAYIKLRYPFWNLQPVYHTYDFWRMIYREPFFIYKKAISTKFVDLNSINTVIYEDREYSYILSIVESPEIEKNKIDPLQATSL